MAKKLGALLLFISIVCSMVLLIAHPSYSYSIPIIIPSEGGDTQSYLDDSDPNIKRLASSFLHYNKSVSFDVTTEDIRNSEYAYVIGWLSYSGADPNIDKTFNGFVPGKNDLLPIDMFLTQEEKEKIKWAEDQIQNLSSINMGF